MRKNRKVKIENVVRELLCFMGENPDREGLLRTPRRMSESLKFLTKGYDDNLKKIINGAMYDEPYKEMVIVKNIDFYSMCEHHLLPFFGRMHIAYIPNGRIVGLSKIPRIVDMFGRRLQVQERLTKQIAETLFDLLKPDGVGVVCEAQHMCMMMRGVEKQNSLATTSAMVGTFETNPKTRSEFLTLISR